MPHRRAGTVPDTGARYGPGSAAHRFAKSYALRRVRGTGSAVVAAALKFFRTGIDDLPEILAVLDLLHGGGQPAVAPDPFLHRLRIVSHQVRGALVARDLDA